MVCQERLPITFVLLWCHENLDYIKDMSGASTFAENIKKIFRSIPVLVPSDPLLIAHYKLNLPHYNHTIASTNENATRDLLLPELMSGVICLAEPERAVEAVV